MTPVYLSLGSNINRQHHILAALDALNYWFGELTISPVYESKSVGFNGSNFYNLVVGIHTDLKLADLSETLKQIEDENGRVRSGPKFSPRSLDIDILTYGNFVGVEAGIELPRAEITKNAFVLLPLAKIAPGVLHPALQQSYAQLWQAYDQASQLLWPIDFEWCGKTISSVQS
ncbi:MAG TPA: 2-amino-4-hydroxy-6-hydroxymethyldihydropteridine diphosphokinase [Cellvibrio sp.]|nr:2-amino-4-hydroxy-6-hydroxymethyldihydropteridine diphosphokinase [Cellvibrio sp.]